VGYRIVGVSRFALYELWASQGCKSSEIIHLEQNRIFFQKLTSGFVSIETMSFTTFFFL